MQRHASKLLVVEKLPKLGLKSKYNGKLTASELTCPSILMKNLSSSNIVRGKERILLYTNVDLGRAKFQHDKLIHSYSQSFSYLHSINKSNVRDNILLNRNDHTRQNISTLLGGVLSARTFSTTNFNNQNVNETVMKINEGNTSEQPLISNSTEISDTNQSSVIKEPEVSDLKSDNVLPSSPKLDDAKNNELVLDFLPERPSPVDSDPSSVFLGMDPPLESLGLASWWPPGRVQYFMEFLHSTTGLDLPWWQAIIISTVLIRMLVFPFVVIAQRNVARLNNNMPQLQKLQEKMSDARRRGDMYDSAALGGEMQKFMKEKNVNPIKNFVPILFQFPFFMSMFIGLRGMANLPLESMMSGGLYWFHNLTVPDPYYILPILTSTTLYLQIHLGADGMTTQNLGPMAKNAMKAFPVILFLFTMNFPAAITFYWFTTNLISVLQAKAIRQESLRQKLDIPKLIVWDKNKLPVKEKSMKESFTETMDNWKVQQEVMDRRTVDASAFREAGTKQPKKTFRHDPTKPKTRLR